MQTSGNTILITGGTSGIGLGFAKEFYKDGNTVIICGRRSHRLAQIKQEFPGIITKLCDVADTFHRHELYQWVVSNYPEINVLINNAGTQLATDLTKPINLEEMRSEVETNFIAPVHLSSLFAEHLSGISNGAIINITSGLAFVPIAFMPVYCATKAALHSICLSMRYQFRNTSVKVFEIAPPAVDTELGHQRREDTTQSHGGISINEFIKEAMEALKNDVLEAPIASAKGLREKGEALFSIMNQ